MKDLINCYLGGKSMNFLVKNFHLAHATVKNILLKNNIMIRDREESKRLSREKHIEIPEELLERIEGELLGDGGMYSSKYQAACKFTSKHLEYMEWLSSCFEKFSIPLSNGGIKKVQQCDSRTNKIYTRFAFGTKCSIEFKEIYNVWYINGIKTVPQALKLTPNTVLHWWLGDGSINIRSGSLCTDCFTENEVIFLSNLLNNTFGLKTKACPRKNPSGKVIFRIYFPQKSLINLLEIIGESPIKSLSYRWEIKK
ncbi:MAG: hypothetical protein WC516_07320 [Patescibacteria group bacterium]|jgi:hypothetical protein